MVAPMLRHWKINGTRIDWFCVPFYPITSRDILWHPIISHYIPSYPIISHYIPSYPIISHRIPLYPIISYYIILYPIISYYIPLYHTISQHIPFSPHLIVVALSALSEVIGNFPFASNCSNHGASGNSARLHFAGCWSYIISIYVYLFGDYIKRKTNHGLWALNYEYSLFIRLILLEFSKTEDLPWDLACRAEVSAVALPTCFGCLFHLRGAGWPVANAATKSQVWKATFGRWHHEPDTYGQDPPSRHWQWSTGRSLSKKISFTRYVA